MPRRAEELARRALLDDPPEIHDRRPVGESADDAEVVADEEVRRAGRGRLLELGEQVQDLGADGDVERRDRLVEDDERGSVASARAIAIRCRCPPENSPRAPFGER